MPSTDGRIDGQGESSTCLLPPRIHEHTHTHETKTRIAQSLIIPVPHYHGYITWASWCLKSVIDWHLVVNRACHPGSHYWDYYSAVQWRGMLSWWPILWLLLWCPLSKSRHCKSFQDRTEINFIYGCPMLKWVAVIIAWYQDSMAVRQHPILLWWDVVTNFLILDACVIIVCTRRYDG